MSKRDVCSYAHQRSRTAILHLIELYRAPLLLYCTQPGCPLSVLLLCVFDWDRFTQHGHTTICCSAGKSGYVVCHQANHLPVFKNIVQSCGWVLTFFCKFQALVCFSNALNMHSTYFWKFTKVNKNYPYKVTFMLWLLPLIPKCMKCIIKMLHYCNTDALPVEDICVGLPYLNTCCASHHLTIL